jgi:hypothetical protein
MFAPQITVLGHMQNQVLKTRAQPVPQKRRNEHGQPNFFRQAEAEEIRSKNITYKASRGGLCRSVKDLLGSSERFVVPDHARTIPFMRTAPADAIFEKTQRICKGIS